MKKITHGMDKMGNVVSVGDKVIVSRKKSRLYKIVSINEIKDENGLFPVYELEPIIKDTIYRGEHQITLI